MDEGCGRPFILPIVGDVGGDAFDWDIALWEKDEVPFAGGVRNGCDWEGRLVS